MKRFVVRLVMAVLLFSGLGASFVQAQTDQLRGIYAYGAMYTQYTKQNGTQWYINSSVLSNPNVDGVALKVAWNATETADGVYAWGPLDSMIAQAAGAGKTVTLDVVAGYQTPSFVFAEGAQAFSYVWSYAWGPGVCSVVTIPVPWDPIYLQKWTAFVQAFGARYANDPKVTGVKISGVNSNDEETALPYSVNAPISSGGASCTSYNDVANWQAAGYTRTLIESAWQQSAAAFKSAFPNQVLVATLQMGGFPPIDNNGNIFTPGKYSAGQDSQVSLDITAYGYSVYGAQFALQNDGLMSSGGAWSTETSYANEITTGYQTFSALGSGLPAALKLATGAHAEYFELYLSDLNTSSLQSAIATTHASLW